MKFNLKNYIKVLKTFQDDGYEIFPIGTIKKPKKTNQILLRHDVDFEISSALKMAEIETKNKIKSSYYFLLRSNSYNLFSSTATSQLHRIKQLGHEIGLHFDASIYEDVETGLNKEVKIFENIFQTKITFITIHRPSKEFTKGSKQFGKIRHSYEGLFFSDIGYFSDSGGKFNHGLPQDSNGYSNRETFQFLTHPIWWVTKGKSEIQKLKEFQQVRSKELSSHIALNCLPWKRYLSKKNLS